MGKKSSPAPPDYTGAAEATAQGSREMNEQQTWANRPDQFTPFGSQTWQNQQVWDPTTEQYLNRWAQTTQLDPMTQWALDNQQYLQGSRSELGGAMMDRAWDEFGSPMDWNQFEDYAATPDAYLMDPMQQAGAVDTSWMQNVQAGPGAYGPQMQGVDANVNQYGAQFGIGQTPEEIRNRAEGAIYDRSASRLDPQWDRREGDLEAKLVGQGLRVGDEAYDRAMREHTEGRTDAYQQAQYGAIMGGGEEGQRDYGQRMGMANLYNQAGQQQYGQDLGASQQYNQAMQQRYGQQLGMGEFDLQNQQQRFAQEAALRQMQFGEEGQQRDAYNRQQQQQWEAQRGQYDQYFNQQQNQFSMQNQLRQAQMAEEMQRRGFSLNEINALISGQQVGMPEMPGFTNAGKAEHADYLGAADRQYQGELQQSSSSNAAGSDMMGGLFQLGSTAMMFSDRLLKENIRRVGTTPGGLPWYTWTYVWGEDSQGVMADEAPADSVYTHPSGYQMVDYARIS